MSCIDHIALEVANLDSKVEMLTRSFGLRVLRWGERFKTGQRIVMLGDGTGTKIELIESGDATPRFVHLAFRVDDTDETHEALVADAWQTANPPHDLGSARARTALLSDGEGLEVQVVTYQPTSPDMVRWAPLDGSRPA